MSYRKRDIGHWNQGKGCKGSRKAKEREFIRTDIKQQLQEEKEDFKYRHRAKRTPNIEARLEYRINWYKQTIKQYGNKNSSLKNMFSHSLKIAEERLSKLRESKN